MENSRLLIFDNKICFVRVLKTLFFITIELFFYWQVTDCTYRNNVEIRSVFADVSNRDD